jgi:hypothetical protein
MQQSIESGKSRVALTYKTELRNQVISLVSAHHICYGTYLKISFT